MEASIQAELRWFDANRKLAVPSRIAGFPHAFSPHVSPTRQARFGIYNPWSRESRLKVRPTQHLAKPYILATFAAPRDTSCNLAAPRGIYTAAPPRYFLQQGCQCASRSNPSSFFPMRTKVPPTRGFDLLQSAFLHARENSLPDPKTWVSSQTLLPPCKHTFGCERKGPRAPRATSRYTH